MMKKIILAVMVLIVFSTSACKKEYESIGLPASKIDGVVARWVLTDFIITDKATIVEEKMDMTDFFSSNASLPNIVFTISGTDTTYACDTTGLPFNVFGTTTGKWKFDDINFPTKILLIPANGDATVEFNLLAPIRTVDNSLKISKSINCNGNAAFTYDLSFNRSVN